MGKLILNIKKTNFLSFLAVCTQALTLHKSNSPHSNSYNFPDVVESDGRIEKGKLRVIAKFDDLFHIFPQLEDLPSDKPQKLDEHMLDTFNQFREHSQKEWLEVEESDQTLTESQWQARPSLSVSDMSLGELKDALRNKCIDVTPSDDLGFLLPSFTKVYARGGVPHRLRLVNGHIQMQSQHHSTLYALQNPGFVNEFTDIKLTDFSWSKIRGSLSTSSAHTKGEEGAFKDGLKVRIANEEEFRNKNFILKVMKDRHEVEQPSNLVIVDFVKEFVIQSVLSLRAERYNKSQTEGSFPPVRYLKPMLVELSCNGRRMIGMLEEMLPNFHKQGFLDFPIDDHTSPSDSNVTSIVTVGSQIQAFLAWNRKKGNTAISDFQGEYRAGHQGRESEIVLTDGMLIPKHEEYHVLQDLRKESRSLY